MATGLDCNISTAPCGMIKPCENNGTCANKNIALLKVIFEIVYQDLIVRNVRSKIEHVKATLVGTMIWNHLIRLLRSLSSAKDIYLSVFFIWQDGALISLSNNLIWVWSIWRLLHTSCITQITLKPIFHYCNKKASVTENSKNKIKRSSRIQDGFIQYLVQTCLPWISSIWDHFRGNQILFRGNFAKIQ
jgi:hypothetical protein